MFENLEEKISYHNKCHFIILGLSFLKSIFIGAHWVLLNYGFLILTLLITEPFITESVSLQTTFFFFFFENSINQCFFVRIVVKFILPFIISPFHPQGALLGPYNNTIICFYNFPFFLALFVVIIGFFDNISSALCAVNVFESLSTQTAVGNLYFAIVTCKGKYRQPRLSGGLGDCYIELRH